MTQYPFDYNRESLVRRVATSTELLLSMTHTTLGRAIVTPVISWLCDEEDASVHTALRQRTEEYLAERPEMYEKVGRIAMGTGLSAVVAYAMYKTGVNPIAPYIDSIQSRSYT